MLADMKRTKVFQIILLIVTLVMSVKACIPFVTGFAENEEDVVADLMITIVCIVLNIAIQCIRRDVEDNLEVVKKRCLEECRQVETRKGEDGKK